MNDMTSSTVTTQELEDLSEFGALEAHAQISYLEFSELICEIEAIRQQLEAQRDAHQQQRSEFGAKLRAVEDEEEGRNDIRTADYSAIHQSCLEALHPRELPVADAAGADLDLVQRRQRIVSLIEETKVAQHELLVAQQRQYVEAELDAYDERRRGLTTGRRNFALAVLTAVALLSVAFVGVVPLMWIWFYVLLKIGAQALTYSGNEAYLSLKTALPWVEHARETRGTRPLTQAEMVAVVEEIEESKTQSGMLKRWSNCLHIWLAGTCVLATVVGAIFGALGAPVYLIAAVVHMALFANERSKSGASVTRAIASPTS